MNKIGARINRFIDFCICLCFFPEGIRIVSFLSIKGLHAIAEKFFLYMIAKNISAEGDILEVGSYFGASSLLLALGNELSHKRGKVWLVEPSPQPDKESFLRTFSSRGLDKNIVLINKNSSEAAGDLKSVFRFIFIDGDHEYESVKKDILMCEPILANGGIIALHNISWPGVSKAADELIFRSHGLSVLGVIADTLYASKGSRENMEVVYKFRKLHSVRERCINIGRAISIY